MSRTLKGAAVLLGFLSLAGLAGTAGAYQTYTDCAPCHGAFLNTPYTSLASAKAGATWPGGLHDTHRNGATGSPPGMLNSNCSACHSGASRTPVQIGISDGTAPFNQSCAGCHDGPGLRAHHRNSGASTCSCHTGDPTPAAENVPRPVYTAAFGTTSGTVRVKDPCHPAAATFEGRLADATTLGLDNDGNLAYDAADAACAQVNRAPTLGALTPSLLTSAPGVARTFRAVYRDADGFADLKTVDFLVSPTGGAANAIMVRYFRATNRLRMFNNAGTGMLAGACTPGVAGTLQNTQGRLVCGSTTAAGSGTSLVMNFRIVPKAAFAGATAKQMRMRAIDNAGATTGLVRKGSWTIR
ncbi:MAG TPA: hypothetical protein VI078_03385 [bacterium]